MWLVKFILLLCQTLWAFFIRKSPFSQIIWSNQLRCDSEVGSLVTFESKIKGKHLYYNQIKNSTLITSKNMAVIICKVLVYKYLAPVSFRDLSYGTNACLPLTL